MKRFLKALGVVMIFIVGFFGISFLLIHFWLPGFYIFAGLLAVVSAAARIMEDVE